MQPPKHNVTLPKDVDQSLSIESNGDSTVLDHLCGQTEDSFLKSDGSLSNNNDDESSEPDVNLNQAQGAWVPDLTLRYPPTFSDKDLIFGVDGGILVDGTPASNSQIERPRLDNLSVLRDQVNTY